MLDDASVDFGYVGLLGEVGGEVGGAEEFELGVVVGDGGGSFDGGHCDSIVELFIFKCRLCCAVMCNVC